MAVITDAIVKLQESTFDGTYEGVSLPPTGAVLDRQFHLSPEDSDQRGVDGVSVKDVHVVPTAFCGEVVEAQPQHRVGTAGERAHGERHNRRGTTFTSLLHDAVTDCGATLTSWGIEFSFQNALMDIHHMSFPVFRCKLQLFFFPSVPVHQF